MRRRLSLVSSAVVLFLLALASLVPLNASAQDASLCDTAYGAEVGTEFDGYTVVYGTGGAGSQLVLGTEGSDSLSGGSGHGSVYNIYGGAFGDEDDDSVTTLYARNFYGGDGDDEVIN